MKQDKLTSSQKEIGEKLLKSKEIQEEQEMKNKENLELEEKSRVLLEQKINLKSRNSNKFK